MFYMRSQDHVRIETFILPSAHPAMVLRKGRDPYGNPGEGLARDRAGKARARDRAHGMREDAGCILMGDQSAHLGRVAAGQSPRPLHFALEGIEQRRPEKPPEASSGTSGIFLASQGFLFPEITVLTRSGDTPGEERRKMVRKPPEILITTPESLNLLLSSRSGRSMLTGIATVILDEIHAVVGTKRGTHLITARGPAGPARRRIPAHRALRHGQSP